MPTKTHWKKLNNPDFLGAYALNPGEDLIATIKSAKEEQFVGTGGKRDEGLVIHFEESDVKPFICNATNAKAITKVVGSPYIEDWKGQKVQFYVAEVSAFGETVDALRVRLFAPKVEGYFCSSCGAKIEKSGRFEPRTIAESSRKKFGKVLCMECGKAEAARIEEEDRASDLLGGSEDENN